MSVQFLHPPQELTAALFGTHTPRVIAFVGAGGKTTAIKTAAHQLRTAGKRVIVTTTTKMHPPEDTGLLTDDVRKAAALLDSGYIAWFGTYYNEFKIEGVPESFSALTELADVVLIEADGARKHPLKMIDRTHEPVIPPETEAVVAVAGMDAVGQTVGNIVHRPELACAALGVSPAHIVTPADAAELLKICYTPRYVILNKADTPERVGTGIAVAEHLPEATCIITALREFGFSENIVSADCIPETNAL